ncbi:MAG: phosphonate ABC transporter, permease protein PhnE [Chloroflexi bacterium]|nr:phosphonate ABC transporter, permease protein PhnE [Chloroflexota bacterium]
MAEYFAARGLPIPPELQRNPLTDWRKWSIAAAVIAILYVGVRLLDIDISRANPEYGFTQIFRLLRFDFSILTPQNEFETFWDTALGLMIVTIFLGIVATAMAVVVALPLAFLGARNIMTGHPVTAAIYGFIRVLFTIIRSIDVLIVVIITTIFFGLGSAAGVFGLAFHNVGVLGKLYSEAVEGIDPGPGEAITATGANRLQVIWAAVLPQIVNPFISFSIYRLDANVRLAPILGFVGGGGIGQMLFQSTQLLQYEKAGLIVFMIVVTVAAMDFASAQVRKRLA